MPLPTAAELTDPNATNTQMKNRLAQLAESVASKEDVLEKFNDISEKSVNIFNKNKVLANTSISTTGAIEADSLRWLSDFMEFSLGETVQITAGTYRIALFDANKQFITRTGTTNNEAGNATYTNSAISLAKYFRISGTNNVNEIMVNKGTALLPFENFGIYIKPSVLPEFEMPVVEPQMTSFFSKSNNLFDKSKILAHTSISTTGAIEADSLRWLSDFMEFSLGETVQITAGTYRIALFDANKQFITRTGTTNNEAGNATYTNSAISLAKYFRISGTNNVNEIMMNKGENLLQYEDFGTFIKPESIPKIEQEIPVITPEMTDFFAVSKNLFDKSKILANTSISTAGAIEADSLRWLSDYIEVIPGEKINLTGYTYRIALFDANKQFITRTGTGTADIESAQYAIPTSVRFVRISSDISADEIMMNKGENLLQYEDFGIFLKPSYIQKSESNNEGNEENTVTRPLFEQAYEPSFPTLNFVEIEQTWRRPYWMSEDGAVIYGAYGAQLIQSKDEWTTKVQVGTVSLPQTILAIRTLADGELLIYCSRNEAQSVKGKLYKTVGYDRNDPSVATFKEVFEILSTQADINNTWGLSVYQNVVVASEYGLRGANGAKHVYLSTDYGETFSLIFNLYTQEVVGRPPLTDSAHTHTCAYDPYYNRIWVVVGDRPNTASYFSDDLGQTWTFIQGSEEVQYTGIQALPDCVIFGSDRAPNGVYVYYRNGKDKHPIIQPLFIINDSEELTNVFGLPFKKDWHPQSPTYFVADKTEGTNYKPQIVATVDGRKAHFMYEHPTSVRMWAALGPTVQGSIIAVIQPESNPNGLVILKAPSPNWIKV